MLPKVATLQLIQPQPQPALFFALPAAEQEVKWRAIRAEEEKATLFKQKTTARREIKEARKKKQEAKYAMK
jgi:hypothetical protein